MKKILLLLSFAPLLISAQTLDPNAFYNKGAAVYVQPGALLHVQGTLTNEGDLNTDGVIEVKGGIDNTLGTRFYPANPGSGTEKVVKFIGDGVQTIKGDFYSNPTDNSFYNLVIDKGVSNSSNTSYVELLDNVRINGSLVFGSATPSGSYTPTANSTVTNNSGKGVIRTYDALDNDYELYVANPAISSVAGYASLTMNRTTSSTDSFVQTRGARGDGDGGLKRAVNQTGTPYVYPIGTASKGYQGLRINFETINNGADDVRGMFCNGSSNVSGYVGKVSQHCIGCGGTQLPDNGGLNVLFGADAIWPGSLPNPCSPGAQQWVILEDGIKNHGYWSFDGTDPANSSTYSLETFPTHFTDEGMVEPYYSEETWRTMHYRSAVNDDPSQSGDNWTDMSSTSAPGYPFAISDMSDLVTYTRNTQCYPFANPGVPGGIYTGFSHFAIKKSASNNALPVELIYLKAEPVNNEFIQVSWATAVEINNRGFEVMRSTDGINFTNIGWVDGHNNSTTTQTYTFDDHNVIPNVIYYYKLNQVDNDGHNEETYVVNAMITSGDVFSVSEFIPNPAKDQSRVIVNTSVAQTINVKLYDMLGRELSLYTHHLIAGENAIYFDTNILSDATYTAVITAGNKVYSKKLVVAKQ